MDEPPKGLAPPIIAEVGSTIARLNAEPRSIVLVEHNSNLALGLAPHTTMFNTGRVVLTAPPTACAPRLDR